MLCPHMAEKQQEENLCPSEFVFQKLNTQCSINSLPNTYALGIKFLKHEFWGTQSDYSRISY